MAGLTSGVSFNTGAGADVVALWEKNQALHPNVLRKVWEEKVETPNKLVNEIFPTTSYNSDSIIRVIMYSPEGIMSPFGGGEFIQKKLPGGQAEQYFVGEWGNEYYFNRKDIMGAYVANDTGATLLGQQGLAQKAIMQLEYTHKMRMANLVGSAIQDGSISVSENGVVYDQCFGADPTIRLDLNNSAASGYTDVRDLAFGSWTPGGETGLWSNHSDSTPYNDLLNLKYYYSTVFGANITKIYMSLKTWTDILLNEATNAKLQGIQLVNKLDAFSNMLGLNIELYDERFNASASLTSTITADSSTTFTVSNPEYFAYLAAGEPITITSGEGKTIASRIVSFDSISGNTVTISATTDNTFYSGARLEFKPRFINSDRIVVKTDKVYQQAMSLPNSITGKPGKYVITEPNYSKIDLGVRVVGGERWGLAHIKSGGYGVLRVS